MPTKARAAATTAHAQAREDIMNPQAISALSAGAVSAMSAVGAAVIKKHKHMMDKKPGMVLAHVREVRGQGRPHRRAGRARPSGVRRRGIHRDLCQESAEADDRRARRARKSSKRKLSPGAVATRWSIRRVKLDNVRSGV